MPRAFLLLFLLLATACQKSAPETPYLRVTADGGRLYYADLRNTLHSPTGGFLAFRDLVTNERVRLSEGTYRTETVPFSEVERQRRRYMYNPSRPPRVENDK